MTPSIGTIRVDGLSVAVHRFNTVVVGSGAAGLNAADYLHGHGQRNVAIVTEGLGMGTSLNTGSDKQTYYKLSLGGGVDDSVRAVARALFSGGAMDGDIALAEAAGSAYAFFRLVDKGVPFPDNASGEFIGYKTDHDPANRGSSCGPLTSRYMTERLLESVKDRGIPIFDRRQIIEILTATDSGGNRRAVGVLALDLDRLDDPDRRYTVFAAENVIYATGGEAAMYAASAYPPSQTGSSGVAFRAGVRGKNLTESQFGIASIKFRWNLSGSYQQVIPRYVSTLPDGSDESEFLDPFFDDAEKLLRAIFLKGYQWPFDPRKAMDCGSSLIDILVYHETVIRGRRVFLDFRRNPSRGDKNGALDFGLLGSEPREYLVKSGATQATPIERLRHMNPAAVELYRNNGIDIANEYLEAAVCAQHANGGLAADNWWQSRDVGHFFPVGEVNGSHGVYRPGGSALNSGQVGGMRAARYIIARCPGDGPSAPALAEAAGAQLEAAVRFGEKALAAPAAAIDLAAERALLQARMSRYAGHVRSAGGVRKALSEARDQLSRIEGDVSIAGPEQLRALHQLRDLVVCHFVYLSAIDDYISVGGGGRGSFLVHSDGGVLPAAGLPEQFAFLLDDGSRAGIIQEIVYSGQRCQASWRPVRPVPDGDDWFETVWKRCLSGEMFDDGKQ